MDDKPYIWLSFRDPDKNKNLGCCIVTAEDTEDAIEQAWKLGINPGGEALGVAMTSEQRNQCPIEAEKLYSPEELESLDFTQSGI